MHKQNKLKAKQKSWWQTKILKSKHCTLILIYICDLIPLALKRTLCSALVWCSITASLIVVHFLLDYPKNLFYASV